MFSSRAFLARHPLNGLDIFESMIEIGLEVWLRRRYKLELGLRGFQCRILEIGIEISVWFQVKAIWRDGSHHSTGGSVRGGVRVIRCRG